jgi:hypothetical protein
MKINYLFYFKGKKVELWKEKKKLKKTHSKQFNNAM